MRLAEQPSGQLLMAQSRQTQFAHFPIFLAYFIIYSPLLMRRMSINSRRGTCLEASCQSVSLETFACPHTRYPCLNTYLCHTAFYSCNWQRLGLLVNVHIHTVFLKQKQILLSVMLSVGMSVDPKVIMIQHGVLLKAVTLKTHLSEHGQKTKACDTPNRHQRTIRLMKADCCP